MSDLTETLMPSTTPPLPTLALSAPNATTLQSSCLVPVREDFWSEDATSMLIDAATTLQSSRPLPVCEDCWSEDATSTLIDAWGRRYMELNRRNLRQKDWQDVADAVNALHGHTKKTHPTDIQCKNRIDTIKKKYRIEKARVSSSNGTLTSSWTFFDRLDSLIGSNVTVKKQTSTPVPIPIQIQHPPSLSQSPPVEVPLYYKKAITRSPSNSVESALVQKRPSLAMDKGFFRRNYSAMASEAAAAEADDVEDEEEEGDVEERESEEVVVEREGMRSLARATERFREVYERVEREKLRQMVELEKLRMQLANDLEVQRMNMFKDTQVQLKRIKHAKRMKERESEEVVVKREGMEIDIEEVKMTDSSEQKKFEIEEIGNEASQTRQPDVIQVEDMQLQAPSTLKPQRVLFDGNAVNILKSSGPIQSQIEHVEMKSEASEQHGFFLMQGGLGLTMPPKDEGWKNAKEIYLMDNELSILPENPRCPNLSALFLPRNYKLRMIPPSFFDHMPALQILNLSRTSIKSLPDSIIKLVSLKRLFLNNCHRLMMLSPKVGDLKQLEVIDLEGARIMDLPMEIKELTDLKCLEVSFYGYISNGKKAMQSNAVVPCGVISALSLLEELNIDVNPDDERWDARAEDIVTEVCTLKRLETLKFYFPRVELLRHFQWNSLKLSHFRFTVGRHVKRIMSRVPCDAEFELERWEKCLKYINGVGVPGDIKKVLQHAVAFFLDRHATVKKLTDFGPRNMKQLKCCVMGECNEVQVIVDEADADEEDDTSKLVSDSFGTERIVLGSLEYLYIYYMKNLRSIWEGSVQKKSLFLLKSLILRTCPQSTTIFTQGLLDNLCNLEELKVEDCPSTKSIVSCEISAEQKTSYFLPNLKKISLHYMPGLISISCGLHIAPKLEWLSFYNCPNLKNPLIDEISSQDLKKIKGERSWWEALEWSNGCPSHLEEIFVPIDVQDC